MSDGEDELDFHINEEFAKKYDVQKEAEELSRLKEKYGDVDTVDEDRLKKVAERKRKWGIKDDEIPGMFSQRSLMDQQLLEDEEESSTDEEEDEDAQMLTREVDVQIMKTIAAIKSKDPDVYDSSRKFFSEEEIAKAREELKRRKEQKPVRIKDYQRQVLLENGGYVDEDNETSNSMKGKTHVEEQQEVKNAFKKAALEDGEDENDHDADDFLVKREKTAQELEEEEEDYKKFLLESIAQDKAGAEAFKDWQDYKDNPNVSSEDAFLMEYILNRGWIEKSNDRVPTYGEIVDDEDEEALEANDRFESKYNFRFEEENASNLMTHARDVIGSVRRKDDTRKRQREARAQRKKEEKEQKAQELKRLKNLKKKEIYERLKQLQEITGNTDVGMDDIDLEGDFDPNKYDREMSTVFNDTYYDVADKKKPEWADDIDIGDIESDKENGGEAEQASGGEEYEAEEDYGNYGGGDDDDLMMDADYLPGGEKYENTFKNSKKFKQGNQEPIQESKKSRKRDFEKYLEEYYQMDYEDMIGDLPTRFKYRMVEKADFGLDPVEILLADDKDLNEVVGLKALAPYRPPEKREKDMLKFRKSKKKRLRDFRKKLKLRLDQIEQEAPEAKRRKKKNKSE
ncbi:hypothetical protein BZG36_03350 [Bifiguratus adelaidae]|uniref:Kri1-like C-terminal domain-containing protein n=1 Tax=Bifiguratus adelaidae TaxID=1938954 RepID=A0A261XWM8_9FUNG|nr:hypothetical protein BZG36_03350 [Bifiguratus adelaidae]